MTDILFPRHRRWLFGVALAVPLLLLLGLGIVSHQSVRAMQRTARESREIDAEKDDAAGLLTAVIDNETGQRGYILSENVAFLEPYQRSLKEIPVVRQKLDAEIQEPPGRVLLAGFIKAMDTRLKFAAETVELQRSGQHEASVALVATGEGKRLMDAVRAEAALLDTRFEKLIKGAETEHAAIVARNEWISWCVVIFDGFFGAFLVMLLMRLRRNEQLLHVCAWSKTVEFDGKWISFEEYLMERFGVNITHGISPAEADKLAAEFRGAREAGGIGG